MQIMEYNPTYIPIRAKVETFSCTETGQDQNDYFLHKQARKTIPTQYHMVHELQLHRKITENSTYNPLDGGAPYGGDELQ
jgi:hypothetical protein